MEAEEQSTVSAECMSGPTRSSAQLGWWRRSFCTLSIVVSLHAVRIAPGIVGGCTARSTALRGTQRLLPGSSDGREVRAVVVESLAAERRGVRGQSLDAVEVAVRASG